jgi:putative ABC transport system permease protein
VRALPGVTAASGATALPVNATRFTPALPEGQPQVPLAQRTLFNVQSVMPGYAAAMRIPVLAGREFDEHDDAPNAPKVVLINRALARRYWPNESAVGKRIWVGRVDQPFQVTGVLGDVRNLNLAEDVKPEMDFPYALLPGLPLNLIVRTAGDPHAMTKAVEQCVLALDREQPVTAVRTMSEILEQGAAQPRFTTSLLSSLALAALALAIVGIYAAIAYSVTERMQEMGIRVALGADRGAILRLVLGRGMLLAGAGIAIGVAASFALTRLMASLLYRVSATDPATFAAAPALFALVALLASYVPARRATRVDPIETLR